MMHRPPKKTPGKPVPPRGGSGMLPKPLPTDPEEYMKWEVVPPVGRKFALIQVGGLTDSGLAIGQWEPTTRLWVLRNDCGALMRLPDYTPWCPLPRFVGGSERTHELAGDKGTP